MDMFRLQDDINDMAVRILPQTTVVQRHINALNQYVLFGDVPRSPFLVALLCRDMDTALACCDTQQAKIAVGLQEIIDKVLPAAGAGSLLSVQSWKNMGGAFGLDMQLSVHRQFDETEAA